MFHKQVRFLAITSILMMFGCIAFTVQALIAESQEWRKLAAGLPGKIETAVTAALKRTITI